MTWKQMIDRSESQVYRVPQPVKVVPDPLSDGSFFSDSRYVSFQTPIPAHVIQERSSRYVSPVPLPAFGDYRSSTPMRTYSPSPVHTPNVSPIYSKYTEEEKREFENVLRWRWSQTPIPIEEQQRSDHMDVVVNDESVVDVHKELKMLLAGQSPVPEQEISESPSRESPTQIPPTQFSPGHESQSIIDAKILHKWYFRFPALLQDPPSNVLPEFVVVGTLSENDSREWHSSAIGQRVSNKEVKTDSGSLYRVSGDINYERMKQRNDRLSILFLENFRFGVPDDWQGLIQAERDRLTAQSQYCAYTSDYEEEEELVQDPKGEELLMTVPEVQENYDNEISIEEEVDHNEEQTKEVNHDDDLLTDIQVEEEEDHTIEPEEYPPTVDTHEEQTDDQTVEFTQEKNISDTIEEDEQEEEDDDNEQVERPTKTSSLPKARVLVLPKKPSLKRKRMETDEEDSESEYEQQGSKVLSYNVSDDDETYFRLRKKRTYDGSDGGEYRPNQTSDSDEGQVNKRKKKRRKRKQTKTSKSTTKQKKSNTKSRSKVKSRK